MRSATAHSLPMKEYRLLAWPELPPEYRRTAHRRALSEMSQRYVSLAKLVEASGLKKAELRAFLEMLDGRAVITPHRAEMASILGAEPEEISELAPYIALHASATFNAVIALKGATTFIATPDGDLFRYECGDVGLATSGSGDTLAGIVAGLLARGADPVHAALWAVWLHGEAGNKLAKRIGRIGYLARELLDEIPPLMRS